MSMYRVSATFYFDNRRKKPATMVAVVLADTEEQAVDKFRQHQGPLDGWYVRAIKIDSDVYTIKC